MRKAVAIFSAVEPHQVEQFVYSLEISAAGLPTVLV